MSVETWLTKAETCVASARLLLASGDTAATCNRAYYAMFNAARAALVAVDQERLSASKTHAGVISAFGQFVVTPGLVDRSIASLMGKEAHRRLVADYQGIPIPDDEAKEAVTDAELFVDAIVRQFRLNP